MKQISMTGGARYMKGEITEEEYDKALERVNQKINKILIDYFAAHHST